MYKRHQVQYACVKSSYNTGRKMIIAKNNNELLVQLKNMDTFVPKRSKGRKSNHTERYIIQKLLLALSSAEQISFPLTLVKRESPDFLLTANQLQVGIEVTEAIPEDYAEYLTYVEKFCQGRIIELSQFHPDKLTQRKNNKTSLSRHTATSPGWSGDEVEKNWKEYILISIRKKEEALLEPSFAKFDEDWLLVYDNTPTISLMRDYLQPYLNEIINSLEHNGFKQIFIITNIIVDEYSESYPIVLNLDQENRRIACYNIT